LNTVCFRTRSHQCWWSWEIKAFGLVEAVYCRGWTWGYEL